MLVKTTLYPPLTLLNLVQLPAQTVAYSTADTERDHRVLNDYVVL